MAALWIPPVVQQGVAAAVAALAEARAAPEDPSCAGGPEAAGSYGLAPSQPRPAATVAPVFAAVSVFPAAAAAAAAASGIGVAAAASRGGPAVVAAVVWADSTAADIAAAALDTVDVAASDEHTAAALVCIAAAGARDGCIAAADTVDTAVDGALAAGIDAVEVRRNAAAGKHIWDPPVKSHIEIWDSLVKTWLAEVAVRSSDDGTTALPSPA